MKKTVDRKKGDFKIYDTPATITKVEGNSNLAYLFLIII